MLMRLVAAGTRMPAWVDAGFSDYADRLRGEYRLELTEVPIAKRGKADLRRVVAAEGRRMLSAIGDREARWVAGPQSTLGTIRRSPLSG